MPILLALIAPTTADLITNSTTARADPSAVAESVLDIAIGAGYCAAIHDGTWRGGQAGQSED
jgi:hypothetical protein